MELSRQLALNMAMFAFLCINHDAILACEEPVEFSYKRGAWNGPEHWGDICKDWETCKTGQMQSPVSIDDKHVVLVHYPEELRWSYHPKNAVMRNLGHKIVIEWEDTVGAVWINTTEYLLKQVHWHTPAENIINGHRYDLEVHLLHQHSTSQKMAMVSILYKVGNPDPFLTKLENHVRTISRKMHAEVDLGIVDPREISREIKQYYRVKGSITIPPCTEGVTWTINKEVRTLSVEQLELLKEAVDYAMNARPTQPLNYRVVQLFE